MQEIKFRAWVNNSKKFEAIEFIGAGQKIFPIYTKDNKYWFPMQGVLEQYTGIKDKNGVDIYDGDIVQHVRAYEDFPEIEPTKIGLPIVVNSGSYVYGKWIAREINRTGFGVNDYKFSEEIQVVGNIHENVDLLEEQ